MKIKRSIEIEIQVIADGKECNTRCRFWRYGECTFFKKNLRRFGGNRGIRAKECVETFGSGK